MSTDVIFPTGITNGTIDSADLILFSDVSASNATKDCTVASLPVSTATQTALDAKVDDSQLDTDGNLAANSDSVIATQKATKTYADTKVTANAGIVGATKTKITYDAKGLVTAGADATTADIAASTDKNYVTDAQAVVIGNTSGTNTGNQTITNSSDGTSHTVTLSASGGSVKLVEGSNITLTTTGTGADGVVTIASTASGSGDVVGPASATDNAVARFDTTTGKLLQDSAVTIADTTGDITAGKYNTVAISGASTPTLSVTGTTAVSGTNTGDQTSIVGITGTKAQFNTAVSDGDIVYLDSTDTITGAKTFSTAPVFNALPTGTAVATANTVSTLVARDASGNFSAGTITAALTGTASGNLVSGGALGTPSSGTLTNCTFPTLNQNTTGYAEALKSATTTVSVSAATAPSSGQVLTATSGTAATWQTPSAGSFAWNATASGTSGVGVTLTKQSGATYNLVAESDYDGNPEISLYQNFTGGTTNTFANFGFRRKLDDGNNREICGLTPYTISDTSAADYNGGLIYNFGNSGSSSGKFGMDYLGRLSIGDYATGITEGGTNGLLFSSGTAATISNGTRGFLYNNSGTLTWVNSGADNQFALTLPNSSGASLVGQTITIGDTQTNALIGLDINTGTAVLSHIGIALKSNRGSYDGNVGIQINSQGSAFQAIAPGAGIRIGDCFNTNSTISVDQISIKNENNAGTGRNTGINITNASTEFSTVGFGAGIRISQTGVDGTALAIRDSGNISCSTNGLFNITLNDTQSGASTLAKFNTGTSANTNIGLDILAIGGRGIQINNVTSTEATTTVRGLLIGTTTFNANSAFNCAHVFLTNSNNAGAGLNTGIQIGNYSTAATISSGNVVKTGMQILQFGVDGTALHIDGTSNINSSTNGLFNITLGNTQSGASTLSKLDTGTSAQANIGQLVNLYNASTTAYGTKYDTSTTGTGIPIYLSTGGTDRKAIKLDTGFTTTTAPAGASKYIIIDIGGTEYKMLAQATA